MLKMPSLRYRIALVIFVLEVAMLGSILWETLYQSNKTVNEFNTASQNASLDLLSNLSITALLTGEYSDYQLYIQDIQKQPSLQRIILADYTGRVVAGSFVTDVGQSINEIIHPNEKGWKVRKVSTPAGYLGKLAVQFSNAELVSAQENTRYISFTLAIVGMSVIAMVGLATGFALTRKLMIVTNAVSRFAKGDYSARSRVSGSDEVALLSHSVDQMASTVEENERQLVEQNEYIELLLNSTDEGIYGIDTNGVCTFVNPACMEMLGYEHEDELIGKAIHELIVCSNRDNCSEPSEPNEIQLYNLQGEFARSDNEVFRRIDGSSFPVEFWSRPIKRDNTQIGTVVSFVDISERKQAEEQIRNLAYFDPLTKLPNRRLLMDRLNQAIISSTRTKQYGALIMLDLDNFKVLNDTRGHDVGDQLLIEVASRLTSLARHEDTVSRLGGDEYVIITEHLGTDKNSAIIKVEAIAEKILNELNNPYYVNANTPPHHSTSSIGLTLFQGESLSVDNLLKQADVALYQSKGAGRNTIRFFNPEMQAAIDSRSEMESAIRKGLKEEKFQIYYQPQFTLDGQLIGAEALCRWFPDTNSKEVLPEQFIPVSEDTNLIIPLGLWVIKTACNQLKKWSYDPRTRDLEICINISASQFHLSNFYDQLHENLISSGANPSLLKIELTESVVLEGIEDVVDRMHKIKRLGVSFSLDDFGTGFSSLSYLKKLPLDQVKIDKSFVRDISTDPNDAAIVQAIIAMCKSMGIQMIAEGVESQEQLDFLVNNGCNRFQGYLFGKPMPIEKWDIFLHDRQNDLIKKAIK